MPRSESTIAPWTRRRANASNGTPSAGSKRRAASTSPIMPTLTSSFSSMCDGHALGQTRRQRLHQTDMRQHQLIARLEVSLTVARHCAPPMARRAAPRRSSADGGTRSAAQAHRVASSDNFGADITYGCEPDCLLAPPSGVKPARRDARIRKQRLAGACGR